MCDSRTYNVDDIQCLVTVEKQLFGTNERLSIYILYHDDASYQVARRFAGTNEVYHLVHLPSTKYFESIVFKSNVFALLSLQSEYTGFITYSFPSKRADLDIPAGLLANPGYDLYAIMYRRRGDGSISTIRDAMGGCTHGPGFYRLFEDLMLALGIHGALDAPIFYSNHWVARTWIVQGYARLVDAAIVLIESDERFSHLASESANYAGGVDEETLSKFSGRAYYTRHPFIMERMICAYVYQKKYSVCYL